MIWWIWQFVLKQEEPKWPHCNVPDGGGTNARGVTRTYTYDLAGQLATENHSSGYFASYSYDANGNRLSKNSSAGTENYVYDSADKLLSVSLNGAPWKAFTYDGAGRTTSQSGPAGARTFAYDFENRVTAMVSAAGTETHTYNGLGARTSMSGPSGTQIIRRNGVSKGSPILSIGNTLVTPGVSENTAAGSVWTHGSIQTLQGATSASSTKVYDAFGSSVQTTGNWLGNFNAGALASTVGSDVRWVGNDLYDSSIGRSALNVRPPDWQIPIDPDDLMVPPAPPGYNARQLGLEQWAKGQAAAMSGNQKVWEQVLNELLWDARPGGRFDPKAHHGGKFEPFGNWLFGYLAAALGLSLEETVFWAGIGEYIDGDRRPPEWGNPWGSHPFGDDPADQHWVRQGWWYYHHNAPKGKGANAPIRGRRPHSLADLYRMVPWAKLPHKYPNVTVWRSPSRIPGIWYSPPTWKY